MKKMLLITAGVAAVAATVIASMVDINKKRTQQVDTIDDTFEDINECINCEDCPHHDECGVIIEDNMDVEDDTTEDETSEENTSDTSEDDTTDINDDKNTIDVNRIMPNDSMVTDFLEARMNASLSEIDVNDYNGRMNHPDAQAYYKYNSFANAVIKLAIMRRLDNYMIYANNESLLHQGPTIGDIIETAATIFYVSEDGKNVVCDHDAYDKLLLLYGEFVVAAGHQNEVGNIIVTGKAFMDCINTVNDIE